MRALGVLVGVLAACAAVAATAAAYPAPDAPAGVRPSWADAQVRAVIAAGAMASSVEAFRPDDSVTQRELADALVELGFPAWAPAAPGRPVTIRELNARMVEALGLIAPARRIRNAALAAGLLPPGSLGTETVARLLGLRINHPQGREALERAPDEPASRAEAAYSLARALQLTELQRQGVAELAVGFALPELDVWQRAVAQRALRLVGYPYVWAGMSERPQELYYGRAPGGFDCSGLVWRVFNADPFVGAPRLSGLLAGRSTFAMSAEMRKADRVGLEELRPADLVFFGSRGVRSVPKEIGHMGIYLGNGWFVHSSANGVTLQPLQGWYRERFAWGRRLLAEAGLAPHRAGASGLYELAAPAAGGEGR
jgi:cell wall-associated NlpC family hydrolase